jgi:hypothetical protein
MSDESTSVLNQGRQNTGGGAGALQRDAHLPFGPGRDRGEGQQHQRDMAAVASLALIPAWY